MTAPRSPIDLADEIIEFSGADCPPEARQELVAILSAWLAEQIEAHDADNYTDAELATLDKAASLLVVSVADLAMCRAAIEQTKEA